MAPPNTDGIGLTRRAGRAGIVAVALLVLLALMAFLPARRSGAAGVQETYLAVLGDFKQATGVKDPAEKRARFKKCLARVTEVMKQEGADEIKDRCLYLSGQIHHHLYDLTGDAGELKLAIENYRNLVKSYPKSALADDAQYLIGVALMANDPDQACRELAKVGILFPQGDMCKRAQEQARQIRANMAKGTRSTQGETEKEKAKSDGESAVAQRKPTDDAGVSGEAPAREKADDADRAAAGSHRHKGSRNRLDKVQYWNGDEYSRVVLTTSGPATYDVKAFPADPGKKDPGRIVLELADCAPSPKVKSRVRIMDEFLQWVLVSKTEGAKTKVVLESRSIETYRVFTMVEPSRIVIDVRGQKQARATTPPPKQEPPAERTKDTPPPEKVKPGSSPSLAMQLGLGVRRIVIDPGHGGKDKGATGFGGLHEKDITLALARELKKVLEEEAHCEVILTRNKDKFISLEERTAIANAQKADLFISIHANANEDPSQHGTETYYLNLTTDKHSARVAALENATSSRRIGDLEAILHDLMRNSKINESSRLAKDIQTRICSRIKSRYETVRDLGVKQAPFYVLMGAEMPGVLVETAFITNEKEAKRLKDKKFQEDIARGIAEGVNTYIRQMKQFASTGEPS